MIFEQRFRINLCSKKASLNRVFSLLFQTLYFCVNVSLDPPQFENCLTRTNPPVDAGSSLDIDCFVTGNPTPSLLCELIDYEDQRIEAKPANG